MSTTTVNTPYFWSALSRPIIGLSPMDGVTDQPYRHIQKKYGKPAVIYTEFASVEGICHGAQRLLQDFLYDETQRPIVGQIYGTTPAYFRQTATLLCELGFDGIDINMGCPAKNVAHSGAGAALIKTPKLAQDIIRATQAGIEDYLNGKRTRDCPDIIEPIWQEVEKRHTALPTEYQQVRDLPVSVKTRIGYDSQVVSEWIPTLMEMNPITIALHGRTLKQQYSGQADWDAIGQAAELVHTTGTGTLLLGNGDVSSLPDALEKIATYGTDGVLIGRATFGNPFIFQNLELDHSDPRRFHIALEHTELYEQTYGGNSHYQFMPMRKHLGWYVKEIPNARQIRIELFQTENVQQVREVLHRHGVI